MIEPGVLIGGRYCIERELTSGGMGTVWLAHHTQLDIDVAVKVISGKLTAVLIERFKREAQAAAKLGGPNIVRVLDYGVHEDQPYLAMELLRGVDLAARLDREGCLAPNAAAIIVRDVARGIQLAHNARIVHRDLKPENIFLEVVDDIEVAKILDFGIAKDLHATSASGALTGEGSVGSPMYMSPEQIWGHDVDFRTDIWSLGVVAFEMLTGVNPFASDRLAKIYDLVTREPIPAASSCNGQLSKDLDRFFERALSRDPSGRFDSVREFALKCAEVLGCSGSPLPSSAEISPSPSLLPFASTQTGKATATTPGVQSAPRNSGGATTHAATTKLPATTEGSTGTDFAVWHARLPALGAAVVLASGVGFWLLSARGEEASVGLPEAAGEQEPPRRSQVQAEPAQSRPSPTQVASPVPSSHAVATPRSGLLESQPCVVNNPPPSCAHPNTIDDMEDNNATVCPVSGRTGYWTVFQDGTSEIFPSRGDQVSTSLIPGCRSTSARAMHVYGKGFTDWGAGMAVKLASGDRTLTDLNQYRAIQFWARSNVPTALRVGLALSKTLEATYGGDCVTTPSNLCHDHFVARRLLSPRWGIYTVSFEEMKQEGWGAPAKFDLSQSMQVHFHVPRPKDVPKLDVDLWIDDVVFLDKEAK